MTVEFETDIIFLLLCCGHTAHKKRSLN